jgi:hypothetical protein
MAEVMAAIEAAFIADPLIDEFGMVFLDDPTADHADLTDHAPDPAAEKKNIVTQTEGPSGSSAHSSTNPTSTPHGHAAVVHDGHKLGLAHYAALPLYRHAHAAFISARSRQQQRVHHDSGDTHGSSPSPTAQAQTAPTPPRTGPSHPTTTATASDVDVRAVLCASTRALCLLNGYFHTGWNVRRRLVLDRHLTVGPELAFSAVVLTVHPKSDTVWRYRRWLLQPDRAAPRGTQTPTLPGDGLDADADAGGADDAHARHAALLRTELTACTAAADRYPKLYYAWVHRQWVLEQLAKLAEEPIWGTIAAELAHVAAWAAKNVTDYSALHHQAVCATHRDAVPDAVATALTATLSRARAYPASDAIWCHVRVLMAASFAHAATTTTDAAESDKHRAALQRTLEGHLPHSATTALWLELHTRSRSLDAGNAALRRLAASAGQQRPGNPLFAAMAMPCE